MGARILIIEDHATNIELMEYLLRASGHETLAVSDGAQGLATARREMPDLVLCDLQMPVMDGYEFARRARADQQLCDIPLIAVTAAAMVGDREKGLASGFDGYLTKPIEPERFVAQVEEFLRKGLHGASVAASATLVSPERSDAHRHTILALDNQPVNLELFVSLFGQSGYRVITTLDPREALRLAHASMPDVIVSDVCMSAGSGYDFLAQVKAEPMLRDIPFVFITSTAASESERAKGLALGASRFLFRPIDPRDLLREIEGCLPKGGE